MLTTQFKQIIILKLWLLITVKMRIDVLIKVSVGYFISFVFLFHQNCPLLSAAKQYIQRYLCVWSGLLSATKRLIICATYLLWNKCRTPVPRKLPCWLLREALFVCLFVCGSQSRVSLCSVRIPTLPLCSFQPSQKFVISVRLSSANNGFPSEVL